MQPRGTMALKMVKCSVLGAKVACLTAGDRTTVLCAARERSTAICRLKVGRSRGGPLSELLERTNDGEASRKGRVCHVCSS